MGGHVIVGKESDVFNACKRDPQAVWWLIVYLLNDGELKYKYFLSSSSEQLPRLMQFITRLYEGGRNHLIFAIWHGRRRTDAFLIKPDVLLRWFNNGRCK